MITKIQPAERTPSLKRSFVRGLARVSGGRVEPRVAQAELSDVAVALLNIAAVVSSVEQRIGHGD